MQMRQHLLELFAYNERTNLELLSKFEQLRDRSECVRLFGHLVRCQIKWLARIRGDPGAAQLDWWKPEIPFELLDPEWRSSVRIWTEYLADKTDEELARETTFTGFDGATWAATPQDIALQLNFHSIHHRAQIQQILRREGIAPDFVDYIGTKYRRIG
jgi:uncharacterized damage-inducible protein DinB